MKMIPSSYDFCTISWTTLRGLMVLVLGCVGVVTLSSRRRSGSPVAVVTRPVLMFMRGHDPARTKQCNCRNHHQQQQQQPASTFIVQVPSLIFDDIILASHLHRAGRSSALLATGLMTCIFPGDPDTRHDTAASATCGGGRVRTS